MIGTLSAVVPKIGASCPEDEYNAYLGKIAAMIRNNATDDELLAYLEWAEVEYIELAPPFNHERGKKVVAALRGLGPPPTSNEGTTVL